MRVWASGLTEAEVIALGRAGGANNGNATEAQALGASAEPANAEKASGGSSGPLGAVRSLFSRGGRSATVSEPAAAKYVKELSALSANRYAFYHRCIGIGLGALLEASSERSQARKAALERLSEAFGFKPAKVLRDDEWFQGALERVFDSEERKLVRERPWRRGRATQQAGHAR